MTATNTSAKKLRPNTLLLHRRRAQRRPPTGPAQPVDTTTKRPVHPEMTVATPFRTAQSDLAHIETYHEKGPPKTAAPCVRLACCD